MTVKKILIIMALSNKEEIFVREYLKNGFNATQAAKKAGYSEKTAYSQGQRLLKKVEIKEELDNQMDKTFKKLDIDREELIMKAFKVTEVYNELLALALKDELTKEERLKFARLQAILKASDSNKAIELIFKAKGWNEPDKQEITHKGIQINYIKPTKDKDE